MIAERIGQAIARYNLHLPKNDGCSNQLRGQPPT
jgi:hypothetical protein